MSFAYLSIISICVFFSHRNSIPYNRHCFRPSAIIPGFNGDNTTTKFIIRFLASMSVGVGLFEIENSSSSTTQAIFNKYHALASATTILTMKELNGKGMDWLFPVLITLFFIGGLLGK